MANFVVPVDCAIHATIGAAPARGSGTTNAPNVCPNMCSPSITPASPAHPIANHVPCPPPPPWTTMPPSGARLASQATTYHRPSVLAYYAPLVPRSVLYPPSRAAKINTITPMAYAWPASAIARPVQLILLVVASSAVLATT